MKKLLNIIILLGMLTGKSYSDDTQLLVPYVNNDLIVKNQLVPGIPSGSVLTYTQPIMTNWVMFDAGDIVWSPKLTANNAPVPFVASASSIAGAGWEAYRLFDGHTNSASLWASTFPAGGNGWVKLDGGSANALTVGTYMVQTYIRNYDAAYHPVSFTVEGSHDNAAWTTIDSQTGLSTRYGECRGAILSPTNGFRYIRFSFTGQGSQLFVQEAMIWDKSAYCLIDCDGADFNAAATSPYSTGWKASDNGTSAETRFTAGLYTTSKKTGYVTYKFRNETAKLSSYTIKAAGYRTTEAPTNWMVRATSNAGTNWFTGSVVNAYAFTSDFQIVTNSLNFSQGYKWYQLYMVSTSTAPPIISEWTLVQ